jgi:hypothetical protein
MDETQLLQSAQEALRRGDKLEARKLLAQAAKSYPQSERAWLWLSAVVDDPQFERECLQRVLAINPNNAVAQQHLQRLAQPDPAQAPGSTELQAPPPPSSPLALLEWYAASLVLPCISPTFYRQAIRRPIGVALGFFVCFALAITAVQMAGVSRNLGTFAAEMRQAFDSGQVPEITVSQGQASLRGPNPFIWEPSGSPETGDSIVILDTTGKYGESSLRSGQYRSGILLTRTTLYNLNNGRIQEYPLTELQTMLGDPLVLDAQFVQTWLGRLQLLILLVLVLSNLAGRLIQLAFLGLLMWRGAIFIRGEAQYLPVVAIGAYATVPAVYGARVLQRIGVTFCGMPVLLLLGIWAIGLAAALLEGRRGIMGGERPLRSWRALIGLPMVVVLALDAILAWPGGPLVVGVVTVLTLVALAAIGLWPILGSKEAQAVP